MAATAIERQPELQPKRAGPSLHVVPGHADDAQARVERHVFRSTVIGMVVGAVVCAGIWALLVAIALVGHGWALGPMLAVGAGCGVFAGMFLGGWAGALVGASQLEHHEHDIRPRA
jgi:fatty acid desaturase